MCAIPTFYGHAFFPIGLSLELMLLLCMVFFLLILQFTAWASRQLVAV